MRSEPTRTRTRALCVLPVVTAALALALAAPATATAQPAPAKTTQTTGTQAALGPVGHHFTGYYTWKSDCEQRGRDGVVRNEWEGFVCINGSWLPGDDYELWVRFW